MQNLGLMQDTLLNELDAPSARVSVSNQSSPVQFSAKGTSEWMPTAMHQSMLVQETPENAPVGLTTRGCTGWALAEIQE
jgi:hypothetical protein